MGLTNTGVSGKEDLTCALLDALTTLFCVSNCLRFCGDVFRSTEYFRSAEHFRPDGAE